MERLLYEASVNGNSSALLSLLQEDPLILDRVTVNNNNNMPLHVASMLGHIDFVKEILIRKPHLAMEPDSQRQLPLHIASTKGHVEVVKALLSASSEACLLLDCDGRNPLHLAAIKGRFDVVKELVQTHPHAARTMVHHDTILHLCVIHNQPEILKFLIETVADHELLNSTDYYGNNILHLAVVYRQTETIKFLLLNTSIQVNASNTNGETPMDILAQGPRDLKYQQILHSLTRGGAVEAKMRSSSKIEIGLDNLHNNKNHASPIDLKKTSTSSDDWLDKKRNTLMIVASLIATMAFQAGINPPSGVWQEDDSKNNPPHYQAGYAVMQYNDPGAYNVFLVCNTVGFVSTLSIILLLISGLPFLKRPFFVWALMAIMWIATSSMSLTYLVSISVLTPKPEAQTFKHVVGGIVLVWIGLMTLLVVGHTIRLIAIAIRGFIRLIINAMRGFRRLLSPRKRPILMNHAGM